MRELRNHLSRWLDEVKRGEEVLITERGKPVARLLGIGAAGEIERLVQEGVIRRAKRRPEPASSKKRIRATGSVSDLVKEQRR